MTEKMEAAKDAGWIRSDKWDSNLDAESVMEREAEDDVSRHVTFRETPTFRSHSSVQDEDENGWRTLTPEQADDEFFHKTPAWGSESSQLEGASGLFR